MRTLIAGIATAATLTACSSAGGEAADNVKSADEPRDPNVVYRLDPETDEVLGKLPIQASIGVAEGFGTVKVDDHTVWVLNTADHTISRIDVATNSINAAVDFDGGIDSGDLALAFGDPWVTDPSNDRVMRVDGASSEVVATTASKKLPTGIAESNGDLWVANHHGVRTTSVWRIDGETNEVLARIPVGETTSHGPQWIAAGAGSLWVGAPSIGGVARIDPETNSVVATIPVRDGGVCGQVIADDAAVWVASGGCGDGAVTRIDPNTNTVAARIESPLWSAAFGGVLAFGSLWITTDGGPMEIDPVTNEIVSRLVLEGDETFGGDLAASADSLWIRNGLSSTLLRLGLP